MIVVKDAGSICRVTLARPEKANALTRAMLLELRDKVQACEAPILVLTGEGKVFSAGADLEEVHQGLSTDPVWEEVSGAIAEYPGLTVAALNGTLAGGASGMAYACDIRITVETAKFFYPVMKLGFLPQPSDPMRLAKLVGPARAKWLLMGGAKITAEEALAWGLVDQIVPNGGLDTAVDSLVADAAAARGDHVRAIKAMFG